MEAPVLTVLTDTHTTLLQTILCTQPPVTGVRAPPVAEGNVSHRRSVISSSTSSKCPASTNTEPPPTRHHAPYTTTYRESHCLRPSSVFCERVSRRRARYALKRAQCESDEFTRSLRQYAPRDPHLNPALASREVLQRLVDYTTRNNFNKLNSNKSSMSRELSRGRSERGTQTYTRTYGDAHKHTSGDVITHKHNKKNNRCGAGGVGGVRGAEVRRLEEVSRCVRDVLRNMYTHEQEFCPRIRSRYEHHRRHHHNNNNKNSTAVNNNIVSSGSKRTADVSVATQSDDAQGAELFRPKTAKICCHCKKPRPCGCDHAPPHNLQQQIRQHVVTWSQRIPVHTHDTQHDKHTRAQITQQLTDELIKLVTTNNIDDVRAVIVQHLQRMPMWTPGDETVKMLFMNDIVEALLVSIEELAHDEALRDDVTKCLKELPLSGESTDNNNVINDVMKVIKDVPKKDNKINLKREIENILRKLSMAADVDKNEIISNVADNLINNITGKEKTTINKNKSLSVEMNNTDSFSRLIEGFPKSLQDLLSKDSYNDNELENTREEISKYLDSLLNSIDVRLHTRTKNKLTDRFMNKIRKQHKRGTNDTTRGENSPETHGSVMEANNDKSNDLTKASLKRRIVDDVTNILDSTDISTRSDSLEANLTDMLADQVMRGVRTSVAAREIHSLLIDNNIPEEQAQYITANLLNRTRDMSHDDGGESSRFNRDNEVIESPNPKFYVVANDVFPSLHQTEQSERKRSGDHEASPDASPTASSIPLPRLRNYETPKKVRRLSFQASTPQQERSPRERRDPPSFGDVSGIPVNEQTITSRKNDSKNEMLASEQKYTRELHDVIESWINELPLNLDVSGGQDYKKTLIHDLVGDIVDRNKYLALSKKAKSSDEEEVEHLRYQVFRWLNKLVDTHELSKLMPNTDQLMTELRDITVPLFKQASGSRTITKRKEGDVPQYKDALEDEISIWMDEIPSNVLRSRNKLSQENMVKALANRIIQSNRSNIDNTIEEWLHDAVRHPDPGHIENMKKSLKMMLEKKGFTDKSHIVQQDTREFIEENLCGAILEWLKERGISSRDQLLLEQVVDELARAMTRVEELSNTDAADVQPNEYFMKQIKKHIQRLPIDNKHKNNEEYISKIAIELLSHLQGLRMFQNVTSRFGDNFTNVTDASNKELSQRNAVTGDENNNSKEKTTQDTDKPAEVTSAREQSSINRRGMKKTANLLNESIAKTCHNIRGDVAPETKQEIANRVISRVEELHQNQEIFHDDALYRDLLTEELEEVLNELHVDESLSSFKRNVVEKINEARNKMINSTSGQTYRQNLKHVINSSVPDADTMSRDQRALFELAKDDLVDAFVNINYSSGNQQLKDKYKNILDKKVTEFCNDYLNRFPATPIDRNKLNEDLHKAMNSVPIPERDALKSEADQTIIKENLRRVIAELPLEQRTPEQKLRTNKIINVLAKNLHEIESHKPELTEAETDEIMREEIAKWLKKLPMTPEQSNNVQEFTNKVVDRMKAKEQSREANAEVSSDEEWTDVSLQTAADQLTDIPDLPSVLTEEDKEHLQRIRDRTQQRQSITTNAATEPRRLPAPTEEPNIEVELLTERDSQTTELSKELVEQATEPPRVLIQSRDASTEETTAERARDSVAGHKCRSCSQQRGPPCYGGWVRGCGGAVEGGSVWEYGGVGGRAVRGGCGGRRVLQSAALGACPKCCGVHCPHPTYLYFK